jgi:hypothetical protein
VIRPNRKFRTHNTPHSITPDGPPHDARQQSDETTISHSVKYLLAGIDLTGMPLLGLLLRAINSFCCKKLNCTEGEESRSFVLMLHTKGKYSDTLAYSSRADRSARYRSPSAFSHEIGAELCLRFNRATQSRLVRSAVSIHTFCAAETFSVPFVNIALK